MNNNDRSPELRDWLRSAITSAAKDEPEPPNDVAVVYLQNEDWMTGMPAAGDKADRFAWQSPGFIEPFEFELAAVRRVWFPVSTVPAWRAHEYRLELAGGDVLFGELLAVTADHLRFRSSVAGDVNVKRSAVRCLERCKANALVYIGPNGLAEWQSPAGEVWREEEGHLTTEKDGASLYSPIPLPDRALVEFELSSLFPPVFRLALGVGDAANRRKGFRLEVVDLDVIAVYETDNDIDVGRVMTLTPGPERDRVHLRVLLDQRAQRAEVFSAEGEPLTTVQIHAEDPKTSPGILLEHKRGGLRFERLRVWEWSGSLPPPVTADQRQLHRVDGTVIDGTLVGYDREKRQFTAKTERGEIACPEEQVARVCFSHPAAPPDRPLRVSCADGSQLSGWFAGSDAQKLSLDCQSIDTAALESTTIPIESIAGLALAYQADAATKTNTVGKDEAMVLRLDTARLHGWLSPAKADEQQSGMAWRPAGATAASAMRRGVSGRVVGTATRTRSRDDASLRYDTLYLTTGDTFRCHVTAIDERGVACHTASAEKQIGHGKIKAIDLADAGGERTGANPFLSSGSPGATPARGIPYQSGTGYGNLLARQREKLERLLILPRLNRDDPPTHILCSTSGDFLRGRLLVMTDEAVRFDVGESTREFPRDRIAAIVWLHPQSKDDGAAEPSTEMANQVHAACSDGTRVTFAVSQTNDATIDGASEVLGDCRLPLNRLTELLIGDRVRQATTKIGYHGWVLTDAPDPKAFQESPDQPGESGRDSSLVGLPAPDFELDLIDGSKFRLSREKGRTVVLDFWASWCAPCVQSLPKLSQTVADFDESAPKLVAVNLQQSADDAKAALERMKIDITVALDRDGAVASRYGATAIPYTVIIDAEGKVARVFMGAGTETEKGIRAAIDELCKRPTEEQPGSGSN